MNDWQVALDDIPLEVPTIPAQDLREIEFEFKQFITSQTSTL
jgi:hypothetical protein